MGMSAGRLLVNCGEDLQNKKFRWKNPLTNLRDAPIICDMNSKGAAVMKHGLRRLFLLPAPCRRPRNIRADAKSYLFHQEAET